MELTVVTAGSHDLGDGISDRVDGAVIRAPGRQIGVEAEAHHGDGVGLPSQDRKLGGHGLGLCQLIFAAIGHGHGSGADTGVKTLDQSFLGTGIEILQAGQKGSGEQVLLAAAFRILIQDLRDASGSELLKIVVLFIRHPDRNVRFLMGAVGIEEGSGNIHNGSASPVHDQPGLFGHHCHNDRLQVLFGRVAHEFIQVFGGHNDRHSLLGFGDGQFCAVQTFILLGYQIQINVQAVRQFADGDRNAARAEVIALFDQSADLRPAEEPLQLSFRRGVALLDLGPAGGQGLLRMGLGRAGGPAHAVTACTAAQQDNDIAGFRVLTDYILSGRRAHDGADLHPLGHIAGMIDFLDLAGSQADLVAVGGIALGRVVDQLFLREFSLQGIRHRNGGVGRAGHAHGLVYIASAGKRIPDSAAQTCSRAAERLDLGGMVVGLIFEKYQPLFRLGTAAVVHFDGHDDRACVVLIRNLHIGQDPVRFQLLHAHQCQIHQADELVFAALIQILPGILVAAEGRLDGRIIISVLKGDILQFRGEGGMAAVIGPVGVQDTDLGHGRIPVLFPGEILLDKTEILEGHGQVQRSVELPQRRFIHIGKALQHRYVRRFRINVCQCFRLLQAGLPGIHGIDAVALDPVKFVVTDPAGQDIGPGCTDHRFLVLIQELDALDGGIGPLVELAGQGLHAEDPGAFRDLNGLPVKDIDGRLGKYGPAGCFKYLV